MHNKNERAFENEVSHTMKFYGLYINNVCKSVMAAYAKPTIFEFGLNLKEQPAISSVEVWEVTMENGKS